jgi:hypothetical protein
MVSIWRFISEGNTRNWCNYKKVYKGANAIMWDSTHRSNYSGEPRRKSILTITWIDYIWMDVTKKMNMTAYLLSKLSNFSIKYYSLNFENLLDLTPSTLNVIIMPSATFTSCKLFIRMLLMRELKDVRHILPVTSCRSWLTIIQPDAKGLHKNPSLYLWHISLDETTVPSLRSKNINH